MGLGTAETTDTPPCEPEMPRTPRKRPGGAGRKDSRQPKTVSPQHQQQPQLQNNIDRYFATQPTPPQSPRSDLPPAKVSDIEDTCGYSGPTTESTAASEFSQKENVPDTTITTVTPVMPSPRKGQSAKRGTSVRQSSDPKGQKQTKARPAPKRAAGNKQGPQQRHDGRNVTEKRVVPTEDSKDEKDVKRITDYFQLRRSHRRPKGEVIKCKQMLMEEKVLHADETGFQVVKFEDKGRGVVSNADLSAGDFVLEYAGDLIDLKEARRREEQYVQDTSVGCYMYYFQHENVNHCIDATRESDRLGRLINHSIRSANLKTKSVKIGGIPRLVFLAKRDISAGEELLYDYGDRNKESLRSHPWLKN